MKTSDICKKHHIDGLLSMLQTPLFNLPPKECSDRDQKEHLEKLCKKIALVFELCLAHEFEQGLQKVLDHVWGTLKIPSLELLFETKILEGSPPHKQATYYNILFQSAYRQGGKERVEKMVHDSFLINASCVRDIVQSPLLIEQCIPRLNTPMVFRLNTLNTSEKDQAVEDAWNTLQATITPKEAVLVWRDVCMNQHGPSLSTTFHAIHQRMVHACASKEPQWWDELEEHHDKLCQENLEYKQNISYFADWMSCMDRHALHRAHAPILLDQPSQSIRKL